MEKLIVRNFGPIKKAEIELTKYVVFIGDTSTGKSVLAKLVSIFRDSFLILSTKKNESIDFAGELKKFNIEFNTSKAKIAYYDGNNKLLELIDNQIVLVDAETKKKNLERIESIVESVIEKFIKETPEAKFLELDKNSFIEKALELSLVNMYSTYIPAERILFSLINNSLSGLWANNVALPECYKDFASKYEVARKEINSSSYKKFDLDYNFNNGNDEIILNKTRLLLSQSSSGIQSLVPLLLVIEYETNKYEGDYNKSFIIEEPELNLFPVKQKKLIDYLIGKIKNKSHKIIFTTHSPYVLSSLDTLMLAKNTFNEHPDLKEEINAIVPESNWIDYNDISVYEVKNGKVYSIKNKEFKSIDTNVIDSVSDIISVEFDKLTDLRYAQ
ncbi:AAA family ATPase [Flavobacterium soli]|uniref:AAA family ATPase n=1 Tax=Flavobacterium soli TaxID=344881 RepID=UPI00042A1FF5|nr:AAA family ATPase [Flavobacterium soli]